MENGRLKVIIFQISKLDSKIIKWKLEEVFNKLDSAAKINSALDMLFVMSKREKIGFTTHTKKKLCLKNRI